MEKSLEEYRTYLVNTDQKMQAEYDKTVITLSGGALGISFAFVKDLIDPNAIQCILVLIFCWIAWGLSVTATLASYFFSHLALRDAIEKLDSAVKSSTTEQYYGNRAGGKYSSLTSLLNSLGGLLFFIGVVLISIFVFYNFGVKNAKQIEKLDTIKQASNRN